MRIFILLFCFSSVIYASTFNNEPNGFRGIKWSDSFKIHQSNFHLIAGKDKSSHIYTRTNEKHSIGGAKLASVWYNFYNGKFASVIIKTKGTANNSALKEAFKARFGSGSKPNQFMDNYIWEGNITRIYLQCSKIKNTCIGYFSSQKINKLKAKIKQQAAKNTAGDF